MKQYTNIWQLYELLKFAKENKLLVGKEWVPARPLGWTSIPYRLKAAWLVFTGKADAVIWPYKQ
jgi:hypothetical protein